MSETVGFALRCDDRYSLYLLSWYKSTNTDAAGACCSALGIGSFGSMDPVLSLLALLIQKYRY